jgi:probable rRNA maturation factor
MTIFELTNESDCPVEEESLKELAEHICDKEGGFRDHVVNLILTKDEEIRKLNRIYRGNDSVTDVLCFPETVFDPDNNGLLSQATLVCDIIIDMLQLDRQRGTKPLDRELLEVLVHSLLHGFGFDHIQHEDKIIMHNKETEYLAWLQRIFASE